MTDVSAAPAVTTLTNPFSSAIATRDLNALAEALAPDAVLHSAVTRTPFEGREVLAELYASLFESFDDLRVVDEFHEGDTYAFFWEGRIDGRNVAGADRLRVDGDGKVREITVVGRPLSGLATFLTGIGFRFARRRRGPAAAWLLRLTALPLGPLFTLLDPVTRWLVRGARFESVTFAVTTGVRAPADRSPSRDRPATRAACRRS